MIYIASNGGQMAYGVQYFVVDTPVDITALKTSCEPGSRAFVISTSESYILSNARKWTKINVAGSPGGGGGGDVNPEDTYVYNGGDIV